MNPPPNSAVSSVCDPEKEASRFYFPVLLQHNVSNIIHRMPTCVAGRMSNLALLKVLLTISFHIWSRLCKLYGSGN